MPNGMASTSSYPMHTGTVRQTAKSLPLQKVKVLTGKDKKNSRPRIKPKHN
jgi:hypothetical protein